ncbi:hypothetical protein M5K25_027314 [Dendrobium thyrsiflorum]|uniref:Large ribosomal subunit protein bL9c n=1 Tax=Dendrobium thyrsiflorum TaxID=117978 RepID=A0ABD0TZH3_DENTH
MGGRGILHGESAFPTGNGRDLTILAQKKAKKTRKAKPQSIILKEDVTELGKKGELLEVKAGFYRNFLLPLGKAQIVTPLLINAAAGLISPVSASSFFPLDRFQMGSSSFSFHDLCFFFLPTDFRICAPSFPTPCNGCRRLVVYFQHLLYHVTEIWEMKIEEERIEAEKRRVKEEAEQLALVFQTVGAFKVKRKGGKGKQIFGSVTAQDLVDIIKAQLSRDVDKRIISLPEIRETGEYIAELKLHPEVTAQLRLNVYAN